MEKQTNVRYERENGLLVKKYEPVEETTPLSERTPSELFGGYVKVERLRTALKAFKEDLNNPILNISKGSKYFLRNRLKKHFGSLAE